ncbi:GntR family transcriptional regulator [Streptomyces sp. NPDC086080]|uniref:GntR family transcriptional regulator n=1 Tax=Streptomyces sp. NPDC086080 TaxID=3365748 RepID=UPI0037D0447F
MAEAGTTQRVADELRRRILVGDLLPGEQLRQERLAGELGISRVPLREALLVLANEGLLVHQPNQGFVVTKRSPDELAQIHLILGLLESELLTNGFVWPNRATLLRMRNLNKRMADLVEAPNWIDIVPLNREFHRVLWNQSPLNVVVAEVERVWSLAAAYIATSYSTRARRAAAVEEHEELLQALTGRDAEALRRAHLAHRETTRSGADASMWGLA